MNNPKTEGIVKILRDIAGKLQGVDQYDSLAVYAAADRLEALEVELEKPKEQRMWIPVTERLPEVSMRTLVSIDDCVGVAYFIHGNSGMCFFSDYTGKPLTFVTHWMPLPEPPKEESDAKAET